MLHVGPQSQRKVLRLAQIQTENNVRTTNVLGFVLGGASNPRLGTDQCRNARAYDSYALAIASPRKLAHPLSAYRAFGSEVS